MVLLPVPADLDEGQLERAHTEGRSRRRLINGLTRYVEISSTVPMRPVSDARYRVNLPFATAAFSAMTYVAATARWRFGDHACALVADAQPAEFVRGA